MVATAFDKLAQQMDKAALDIARAQTAFEKHRAQCSKLFSKAKPSVVLRMAVDDLIAVEKNPKFIVEMSDWVRPGGDDSGTCAVCFGGAVLANRFKMNKFAGDEAELIDIFNGQNEEAARRIYALNLFREGSYIPALENYFEDIPKVVKLMKNKEFTDKLSDLSDKHVDYQESSTKFKACMKKLADFLEANGI